MRGLHLGEDCAIGRLCIRGFYSGYRRVGVAVSYMYIDQGLDDKRQICKKQHRIGIRN